MDPRDMSPYEFREWALDHTEPDLVEVSEIEIIRDLCGQPMSWFTRTRLVSVPARSLKIPIVYPDKKEAKGNE